LAKRLGITLIGYAGRDGFTVYAHPEGLAVGTEVRMERDATRVLPEISPLAFSPRNKDIL
jgi:hypothetical protein